MQYKGGKNGNGTFQTIINEIPVHSVFCELFAGSAAISRFMRKSDITILCDKSGNQCHKLIASNEVNRSVLNIDSVSNIMHMVSLFNALLAAGLRVVVYADPPYPFSSRSYKGKVYQHELNDQDHIALLTGLRSAKFPVLISTYENDIYTNMLSDWRLLKYRSIVRGGTRIEYLYMNYPKPVKLHDYSFLGNNFRQREAIKRQISNLSRKLDDLHPSIFYAVSAAIKKNFNQ